jgi:rhomboid family GlyGly-CTERM serine protease
MHIGVPRKHVSVVALLTVTAVALAFEPESLQQTFAFERETIEQGQFWRLWSAHLVHFSVQHALIDAAAFFIAGMIVEKKMGVHWVAWVLVVIAPTISLGLRLWSPDLMHYRGMSGLATAMIVVAMISIARNNSASRGVILLLAIAFAFKLVGEAFGVSHGLTGLDAGVVVEWHAHVLGAMTGVASMLICGREKMTNTSIGAVCQT